MNKDRTGKTEFRFAGKRNPTSNGRRDGTGFRFEAGLIIEPCVRRVVNPSSSSAAKEVQGLEAKCLLSATPLAEQPALASVDMNSQALTSEAGFIQFNAMG